jgi:hypothetical protein
MQTQTIFDAITSGNIPEFNLSLFPKAREMDREYREKDLELRLKAIRRKKDAN